MIKHYAMATLDGGIQQTISGPYSYVECGPSVSDTTHYVDDNLQIQLKGDIEFEVLVEGLTATLTGLPDGLFVTTNGISAVTDAEPLTITYDVPGTYKVMLQGHIKYLNRVEEVTVGDP